jgi:hypothetical protein
VKNFSESSTALFCTGSARQAGGWTVQGQALVTRQIEFDGEIDVQIETGDGADSALHGHDTETDISEHAGRGT